MFVWVVLSACGGGGGGSGPAIAASPAPSAPELNALTPSAITEILDEGTAVDRNVSFSNSGNAPLTYSLSSSAGWITILDSSTGSVAGGGNATLGVRIDCSAGSQNGAITLATNDSDEADTTIAVDLTCRPLTHDHEIARVMLNQASRAFDSQSSGEMAISTLAGRDLLVRVLAVGTRDIPAGDVVVTTNAVEQKYALIAPPSIDETPPDESLLGAGHYAVVPGVAVQVGAALHVELSGVRYPESGILDLQVEDPGTLGITLVPVTFDGQTPTLDPDVYLRQAVQQLPFGDYQVQVRAPYNFAGAYDLDTLLDEISDLRTMDGSSDLYHGVIVPPDESGTQTAGLAYVGFPVSVSIDLSGTQNIIAHEMGHNFDLGHAPACEAPNPDENFPDAEGGLTNWGYDVIGQTLVDPEFKKDLMSYCTDLWISRYSFRKALDFRLGRSASAGTGGRSLATIRGRLGYSGVGALSVLPGGVPAASTRTHSHVFRAWDRSGRVVLESEFTPMEVAHGRAGEQAFVFATEAPIDAIYAFSVIGPAGVLSEGLMPATAGEIAVNDLGQGLEINWAPRLGHTLVVRNEGGEVVSLSQRATIPLPDSAASIEVLGPNSHIGPARRFTLNLTR